MESDKIYNINKICNNNIYNTSSNIYNTDIYNIYNTNINNIYSTYINHIFNIYDIFRLEYHLENFPRSFFLRQARHKLTKSFKL